MGKKLKSCISVNFCRTEKFFTVLEMAWMWRSDEIVADASRPLDKDGNASEVCTEILLIKWEKYYCKILEWSQINKNPYIPQYGNTMDKFEIYFKIIINKILNEVLSTPKSIVLHNQGSIIRISSNVRVLSIFKLTTYKIHSAIIIGQFWKQFSPWRNWAKT